jgi:hypothetical protein
VVHTGIPPSSAEIIHISLNSILSATGSCMHTKINLHYYILRQTAWELKTECERNNAPINHKIYKSKYTLTV